MCMSEFLEALAARGVPITEAQVRCALKSGKVTRPVMDTSLQFRFGPEHLAGFQELFQGGARDRRKRLGNAA